ncbi:oxidoreductase [Sphingomonas prati]|uniref:NAD(P)-dependent dehydrogenase (Short-subunit alcohol dehydrogenase family) n=1 Tax=Sphingomonas prati TaxID=1843237 RepID=A0A7W9F1A9_9SPHN|nr:oxidoreductase [Sphingomonas prati]MBB5729061.1 NAD(P)-dependent dehydrogenase (short-subunit alcohol dehydrogenase family) [Sphingomonas prati]GGE85406.1 dehydrogenase [Sphingomonas prati]
MISVSSGQEYQSQLEAERPALSRRAFLQTSAVGASVGLVAGCSSGPSNDRGAGRIPDWSAEDIPVLRGRTVLVTGANGYPENGRSGLGYHDALALARAGADVTIASRNQTRGQEAVRRIRAEALHAAVRFERLDLADLASIRAFARQMRNTHRSLDLLVNNAGVMGRLNREVSVNGFERVFATNTLGHFVLTAELMPLLRKGHMSRIVWVSSLRAGSGVLRFDDLQLQKNYDYAAAYDQSKLANLLLAFETERRSRRYGWGVTSVASHPGVARTNLIPNGPGLESPEGWRFQWLPIFQPAATGALPTLYAGTAAGVLPGGYYGPKGIAELRGPPGVAQVPAAARDSRLAQRLWPLLERLGGTSFS